MIDNKPITDIDGYIRTFPKDVQRDLAAIRRTIRKAAPGAEERIGYGIPTFYLNGRGLVSFAGWKRHIAMYGTPAGDAAFRKEVAAYKGTKSSIHFPIGKAIPHDLVRRFVVFRMKERQRKRAQGDAAGRGAGRQVHKP